VSYFDGRDIHRCAENAMSMKTAVVPIPVINAAIGVFGMNQNNSAGIPQNQTAASNGGTTAVSRTSVRRRKRVIWRYS
jgi:hypothetical protein